MLRSTSYLVSYFYESHCCCCFTNLIGILSPVRKTVHKSDGRNRLFDKCCISSVREIQTGVSRVVKLKEMGKRRLKPVVK